MATGSEFATWDMAKAMYETIMATIGPVEASTTASAAHAKGSYFILGGVLYQATAAIAVGDTITTTGSGANCVTVPGGLCASIATLESYATASYTPAQLSAIAASGVADRYFSVGDIITIPWTDRSGETDVEYQYPFIVVDIKEAIDENGNTHTNALWLQAAYATTQAIQFGTPDRLEVNLAEEPNALAGWYYVGRSGSTYTDLELSPGDPIPTTYTTVYKTTYADSPDAAVRFGRAIWSYSDARQWLNSSAAKGEGWWESQYEGAQAPNDTIRLQPGFMAGFSADWKAIFKKTQYLANTVDTVFIPSQNAIHAATATPTTSWTYWRGLIPSPTSGENANRVFAALDDKTGDPVIVTTLTRISARTSYVSQTGAITNNSNHSPNYLFRYTPCVCLF